MKYIRNIIRQMETIALSMGRVRNVQLTARSEPQWSNLSAVTKRIGCLNGPVTFNCKLSAKLLADYAQCAAGSERVSLDFMKKRRRRRRVRGCKDVDILAQPPSFITKIQTQRERHFPDSSSSHWSETSSDTAFNFLLFFFNFFFFFKKEENFLVWWNQGRLLVLSRTRAKDDEALTLRPTQVAPLTFHFGHLLIAHALNNVTTSLLT